MPNVFDVAAYVLEKCGEMTTMKLQKIVYYCQAWSLVWDDEPLFDEDFQAWANGPVCPELFQMHKGRFRIQKKDIVRFTTGETEDVFSPDGIETMDIVISNYADKSPQWLSDLTHNELPWKEARRGYAPGESCNKIIEKDTMQQYYGGLMD